MFTAWGIRVRLHATLLVTMALVLLFGIGVGYSPIDRMYSMGALFGIVLLHEFGHCFAARWMGGDADEIMMTPLGGLAMTGGPQRWWPRFITVAGGPAVNVVICALCGAALYFWFNWTPWRPFWLVNGEQVEHWRAWGRTVFWIYQMSYTPLLFNLLPIFPLDGGQLLQTLLWSKFGYYKSMNFACVTGMAGAVILGAWGMVVASIWLTLIAVQGFLTCLTMRRSLLAAGPYADYEDGYDYSASLRPEPRRHVTKRSIKRAQRVARQEAAEQRKIDMILAKVSAKGMHSLGWTEKRALRKATERQRRGR